MEEEMGTSSVDRSRRCGAQAPSVLTGHDGHREAARMASSDRLHGRWTLRGNKDIGRHLGQGRARPVEGADVERLHGQAGKAVQGWVGHRRAGSSWAPEARAEVGTGVLLEARRWWWNGSESRASKWGWGWARGITGG
jgi:hypothetical protein